MCRKWKVKCILFFRTFKRLFQVEKQRAEISRELEDLSERLDEAGGATSAQVNNFLCCIKVLSFMRLFYNLDKHLITLS